jgi:hypothetical protein
MTYSLPQEAAYFRHVPHIAASSRSYTAWLFGGLLLIVLSATTNENVNLVQTVSAAALLAISLAAFTSWNATRNTTIPAWALVCAAHFVFYGLAVFGAVRKSPSTFDHHRQLTDSSITSAILVGLFGLVSIWLGRALSMRLGIGRSFRFSFLELDAGTPVRIRALLLIGTLANVFGVPLYGTTLWNISVIAFDTLPLAAFLWLVLAKHIRGLARYDLLLGLVFFGTRLLSGAKFNAALGVIVVPLLLLGVLDLYLNRKLRWQVISLLVFVVLFLQPGKKEMRQELRSGNVGSGITDALIRWGDLSASSWADVFSGRETLANQLDVTTSRVSLLTMTGLILERTPERVPFQYGSQYPLLLTNLVPRVLWPDKPSVNVANQFFQVEYGLTRRDNLKAVSIACGFEAEGYMNFGWFGVVAVGVLVGFALGIYELVFFSGSANLTGTAIGLVMLPTFLTIESQLVQYLGGLLQIIFAAAIVFHRLKGATENNPAAQVNSSGQQFCVSH